MAYQRTTLGFIYSGSDDAGPPECTSSNPFTCSRCSGDYDLDDDEYTEDDDGYVCEECRYRCAHCEEICGDWESTEAEIVNGKRICVECVEYRRLGEYEERA